MNSVVASRLFPGADCLQPATNKTLEQQVFANEFDALLAALAHFNPLSAVTASTFSGVVYPVAGGFACAGAGTEAGTLAARCTTDDPTAVALFWRTSGQKDLASRYFSATETTLTNTHTRPSYLANCTGMLKVYLPGDIVLSPVVAERLTGVPQAGLALGKLVHDPYGHIVRVPTRLQKQHLFLRSDSEA